MLNKEKIKQSRKEYYHKNIEKEQAYARKHQQKIRLQALSVIDPRLKCVRCGCDDIRFLEKNHKNGGGSKEAKKRGQREISNYDLINGKRKTNDLEILCRPCNHIHYLELKYGITGLKVIWINHE